MDVEPTPPLASRGDTLEERILRWADGSPPAVRFDRFMEVALYDPAFGYYASHGARLGRAGDFYTAAHVHPLFGETIARRVLQEYVRLGRPPEFHVIDVGCGDGTLAADLATALLPSLRDGERLTIVGVDRSSRMRAAFLACLNRLKGGPAVDAKVADAVASLGPFRGVVIANELLDAGPCRRLVWHSAGWSELFVTRTDDRWSWVERGPAERVVGPLLPDGDAEGLVVEISPEAEGTVREIADHLTEGCALVLDYGGEERDLRSAYPRGTLTAIRDHQVVDEVLARPGDHDLSCFVNFTRVRAAATASGLATLADRPQAEALGAWGFPEILDRALDAAPNAEAEVRLRLAAKNLLFGFERFRVLELGAVGTST